MKGRGRGGHRGGRGGHRADRDGPKLPSSLLAALGQDGAPVQFGRGRGRGGSRKQSRKQEREGHKAARLAHQKARAASKKRAHPDSGAQQQPGPKRHTAQPHGKAVNQPKDKPAKQQNPQQQQQNQQQKQLKAGPAPAAKRAGVPGGSSKTHFHELLPGGALGASVQGANNAAAYIADLIQARTAEKKLGIKKGGALKGPSDGLSHFLSGLSTASGTSLPAYINSNDPVVQRVLPADVLSKARTAAEAKRTEEPVGPIETDSEDEFGLGVLMGGGDESSSEEGDEEGEEEGGSEEGDSEDGDGMEEDEEASDSEGMSEGDSEGMSSEGEEGSDAGPSDDSELEEGRRGDGGGESTRDKEEQEGCGGSSEWEDGAGSSEDGGLLQEGVVGEVSGRRGGLHHLRDSSSGGESERERDSEGDEGEEGEGDSKEGDSEESEGEEDGSTSSGEEEEDGGGGSSGGEEEVQTDIYGRTKGDPAPGGEGAGPGRYVPPALRAAQQRGGGASSALERRVTGLLNRLAEANMSGVAKDVAALYEEHGRRAVGSVVVSQLTQAAARGPRATEQFAATAAAFVAALAVLARAPELVASFLETCAQDLEAALESKDGLARHNLSMVIAHCYSCGMMGADMVYSLLHMLRERFTEDDVQVMVSLLGSCGLQLRAANPAAMKDFVLAVHERVAQVSSQGSGLSTRAKLMLDLVIDIKNNKAPGKSGGDKKGGSSIGGLRLLQWMKPQKVKGKVGGGSVKGMVDEVAVRNISWAKLLIPDKRGMWWLPTAGELLEQGPLGGRPGVGVGVGGQQGLLTAMANDLTLDLGDNGADLLQLAAAQRMNTDVRRAVFVAVMGSDDCMEAFEKLMRLPIKGEQEREIVRVIVDCCMSEKEYNPYYTFLVVKLCQHSKAHRLTTQYCMWDQYKVLSELKPSQRFNLARLNACLLARFQLSLTSLKVIDFSQLDSKAEQFWCTLFRFLLGGCKTLQDVKDIFGRAAQQAKQLGTFLPSLLLFLRTKLGPWLAGMDEEQAAVGKVGQEELLARLLVSEQIVGGGASNANAFL